LGFVSFAERRTFEKARERSVVSKEGWKKEREEILEVVDERWKTPTTRKASGGSARSVSPWHPSIRF
jgi:hypothetical protein